MVWPDDMELGKFMVAAAPFGGPIAMIRDSKKLLRMDATTGDAKSRITVYSASGQFLSHIQWNATNKGSLVYMGWTDTENLYCVTNEGAVFMYDLRGNSIRQFSLGSEARDTGVLDVIGFGSGLVFLTKRSWQLWVVLDFLEPRPIKLSDPVLIAMPLAFEVVPPDATTSGSVEVLVAPETNPTVLLVDMEQTVDQRITNGPFVKLAVRPSGEFVAGFTESGIILVTSIDFTKTLANFNPKTKIPPKQLVWCGEDCVVAYWDPEQLKSETSILIMIGPGGAYHSIPYEGPVILVPECDGVRIITNTKSEFLQRVPNAVVEIFKIGSTTSAALLYDSFVDFEKESATSIKNIRSIKTELSDAVDTCIEAASHELFNLQMQKTLLRAAAYGKTFCEYFNHDQFVDTCKTLRILNAVRQFDVGIPLTITQYKRLTPRVLVDRLVQRHHHLLAYRICEHLKLRAEKVLVHWACAKVQADTAETDVTIKQTIIAKLSQYPGVSYAQVASAAYKSGKRDLAISLLMEEPRAGDQVPLLLDMHEDEKGLQKAIESGDTDLVYLVLLHMKKKLPSREFFSIVTKKPVARDLLIAYCKEQDPEFLKSYYMALDMQFEAAVLNVSESYFYMKQMDERFRRLKLAREHFSRSKTGGFDAKITDDQIQLLEIQRELEERSGQKLFINMSIADTVYHAMLLGEMKKATKIKSEFRMSDKKFWWLKVKALAKMQEWEELQKFAASKKSPIGYAPFVQVCMQQKANHEAVKYVSRITNPQEKVEFYIQLGHFQEALEVAAQLKNVELLKFIQTKSSNSQTQNYINQLIAQFSR